MAEATQNGNPVLDEIAGIEKDIFRDYIGSTLLNPDKILRSESGGKGIELYEDLLRDDQIASDLQTRKLAVVGKEWDVIPASDKRQDVKIAEFVKETLMGCNYDDARRSLLSGIVLGFKPAEVMWDYSEGSVWVKEIIGRASRRFCFSIDRSLRLLTSASMIDGEELPDKKFIIFRSVSDNGSPYGDGLGRSLYWPVWFKKNAIKFWMIFADKFGSPTAVGKYPPGTSKDQQDALLQAIQAIQQEAAVKIPNTMVIELLEAARAGSIDTYDRLCAYFDKKITKVLLGHSGSSESTPGKLGNEDQAKDIRADYVKADADSLCESQNNSLVKWIVDYNFPGVTKYPKVWIRTEGEKDLKTLADRDKILIVDIGLPVGNQYLYDTYGIPKPAEGDELVKVPTPAPSPLAAPPSDVAQPAFAEWKCSCGRSHDFTEFNPLIDRYVQAMAPALQGVRDDAVKEIQAWLESLASAPTEEQFTAHVLQTIDQAYQKIDVSGIAKTVGALYAAGKGEAAGSTALGFGGPDVRAMDFLSQLDNFYVSKFIKNPDAVAGIRDFLQKQYLENGSGLFGRANLDNIRSMMNLLDQNLGDMSAYQLRRIADTSVVRIKNWSHVSQMHDAGIAEIEIVEPTHECAFCDAINGKVISVSAAYSKMSREMAMSPDEYQASFSEPHNQPVIDNIENMVSAGTLPPYHPNCHGKVITRVR